MLDAGARTPSISSFKMADLMRSLEIEFAPIVAGRELDCSRCCSDVHVARCCRTSSPTAIKYTRAEGAAWLLAAANRCRLAFATPASDSRASAARFSRSFTG